MFSEIVFSAPAEGMLDRLELPSKMSATGESDSLVAMLGGWEKEV
jgi:hypothetical protein